uniref:Uncharacterized protein n=1 Tax=Arundo donax TaxID=35708 RepID=A0A0A8Y512_ARUDO
MVGSSSGELRIENHRNEFSFELTKLDGKILSFHDLRALTFFVIAFCQDLSSISLEGFKQLISLKSLEIKHCKKLFSVVPLEQIHEDTADASFNAFPSLEYLKIESSGIAGKWLSVMLRHAPALQELHLRSCQQISGLLMEGKENSLSSSSAPPRNPDDALTSSTPDGLLCIPSNLIPSLKKMLVVGCPDLTFEMSKEGFSGFTSLEELTISNCPELVPSLVHKDENNDQGNGRWLLPHSLVKLRFDDDTTETLQLCFQENRNCLKELEVTASPSLKCLQLHSFTALEELSIEECESLADLDGISTCLKTLILSLNRSLKSLQLRSCTALEKLSIEKCESLAELEGNSTWLKELELSNNQSLKSVQLHCCTALEELEIRRCHLLAALEGLQSLSGLRQLRVSDCPGLPPCLECLPSTRGYELFPRLEILEIDDHSFLTTSFCTHLTSLQRLEIWDCKEVRILTDEQEAAFLFLKSLKELSVLRCENLEHLPLGLHSLRSLKRLEIYNSPCISWLLTVLPLSLEELEVTGCSMELTERCRMLATDKLKVKIGGRYVN